MSERSQLQILYDVLLKGTEAVDPEWDRLRAASAVGEALKLESKLAEAEAERDEAVQREQVAQCGMIRLAQQLAELQDWVSKLLRWISIDEDHATARGCLQNVQDLLADAQTGPDSTPTWKCAHLACADEGGCKEFCGSAECVVYGDQLAVKLAEAEAESAMSEQPKQTQRGAAYQAASKYLDDVAFYSGPDPSTPEYARKHLRAVMKEHRELRRQLAEAQEDRDRVAMEAYEIQKELEQQRDEARRQLADPLVGNLSIAEIIAMAKDQEPLKAQLHRHEQNEQKQMERAIAAEKQLAEAKAERDRYKRSDDHNHKELVNVLRELREACQRLVEAEVERDRLREQLASLCRDAKGVLGAYEDDPGWLDVPLNRLRRAVELIEPKPQSSEQQAKAQARGTGKTELTALKPDPGEGWELCGPLEMEQWRCPPDHPVWNTSRSYPRALELECRRRKVMTRKPHPVVGDFDLVWFRSYDEHWHSVDAGSVRYRWADNAGYAWCHRIDGETEPPKILAEGP